MVSVARVEQALHARRDPPDDPLAVKPPVPVAKLPEEWRLRHESGLRAAAVLVLLLGEPDAPRVLLTERAHHLQHHPGQVSFPGGRVEPQDESLAMTALREANEEVGLAVDAVDVFGYLPTQWTVSGYAMTPVVGYAPTASLPDAWALDPQEVASAFEVPAAYLFHAGNHSESWREFQGVRFANTEIDWEGRHIWGVTARVISQISRIISDG